MCVGDDTLFIHVSCNRSIPLRIGKLRADWVVSAPLRSTHQRVPECAQPADIAASFDFCNRRQRSECRMRLSTFAAALLTLARRARFFTLRLPLQR